MGLVSNELELPLEARNGVELPAAGCVQDARGFGLE